MQAEMYSQKIYSYGQTILSVGSIMLLNTRFRQLGLRPADVGGEGDFFPSSFSSGVW